MGLAIYAIVVAFGFIVYRAENANQALEYLAVPIALAGLPLLLGGTMVSAKLAVDSKSGDEAQAGPSGMPLGIASVIATMMTLSGAIVLLAALAAAWPHPVRLTIIAAVNAVVLVFVAHRYRLTPALVPAQICFAVAALTGYHALAGNLAVDHANRASALLHAWTTPESGVLMVVLGAVFAAAAQWQTRLGRKNDGQVMSIGSMVAASVAAVYVLAWLDWVSLPRSCISVLGIAGIWLAAAWQRRNPVLFAVFQSILGVSVLLGVGSWLTYQPWFTEDIENLLADVRSWQAVGVGLSALALLWVAARFALKSSHALTDLLEPAWPALDRLLLGAMVILAVWVTVAGAGPGALAELTVAQQRRQSSHRCKCPRSWAGRGWDCWPAH